MQAYVFGSLAFDRIMSFPGKFGDHILPDKIHILNVCFVGNGLTERFGGTAGNIAYSLALLGEKPVVLSSAGKDFGLYGEHFDNLGLPTHGITMIEDDFTANCHITTDQSDNQITCFNPCAMNHQCSFDFNSIDAGKDIVVIAPGNLVDMIELPRICKEKGIRYIFDPGQNITALSGADMAECIDGAYCLISNDYELEMIMKSSGLSKEEILAKAENVITTLGEQGSMVYEGNGEGVQVASVKCDAVVDPTGAGDAFRSGLLKGLMLGKSLSEAAKIGSVTAKYAVEKLGTQEHSYDQETFWKVYTENFGPFE